MRCGNEAVPITNPAVEGEREIQFPVISFYKKPTNIVETVGLFDEDGEDFSLYLSDDDEESVPIILQQLSTM